MRLPNFRRLLLHNGARQFFFFVFLFILVLLGDGKQGVVDVIGSVGILCFYIIHRMGGKPIYAPSRPVNFILVGLLFYLATRTVFSDSVGYSMSATLRWVMAYLVFVLFSSSPIGKEQEVRYVRTFLWFGAIAVLTSFVVTVFGRLGQMFPGMNLLYPAYGHNHIANVIVFVFPLSLHQFVKRKNKTSILLFLLFGLGLVFSFARGAWILIIGYLCYLLLANRELSVWIRQIGAGILAVGVATFFSFSLFSGFLPGVITNNPIFRRQIIKDSAFNNRRFYWQEAAAAIQERPFFGAGPGTFYLLSKRFQEAPGRYSWYAHGFLLEFFSEVGIIGVVLLGVLSVFLRRAIFSPAGSTLGALRDGAALTLVYSLYEINLNFLVVWLLFWATLGILFTHAGHRESKRPSKNRLPAVCLGILVLFYISSAAASVLGLFPGTRLFALYSQPYMVTHAKNVIVDEKPVPPPVFGFIELFHRKDPEILEALAQWWTRQKNNQKASFLYESAVKLDPKNPALYIPYVTSLLDGEFYEKALEAIKTYGRTSKEQAMLSTIQYVSGIMTKENINEIRSILELNKDEKLVIKLFYLFGLSIFQVEPKATQSYWDYAIAAGPFWNYIYIEQAAVSFYKLGDEKSASKYLMRCLDFVPKDPFCGEMMIDMRQLPPPGSLRKNILTI